MQERTWTFIDKATWAPGPWQDEPDKVQFTDPATGLPCLIVRNPQGALCGYVGVPPAHPWYGAPYGYQDGCPDEHVEVHGGLTFSGACQRDDPEHGICHLPDPGEPDEVWWFGWDAAHAFDIAPGLEAWERAFLPPRLQQRSRLPGEAYRDLAFVRAECTRLAAQLATVAADLHDLDDGEVPDLGPCCACETTGPRVRNILLLPRQAPPEGRGTGWGCVVCSLPPDGAAAVVCDACLAAEAPPRWHILGFPAAGRRIAAEAYPHEPFEHDAAVPH